VAAYFDCLPESLTPDNLKDYFAALIDSHSWSTVKIDRLGLQLPVAYFMATFTLPAQLRELARQYPKLVYACLFACVHGTLKDFGLNPEHLGAELGMTAVLHTHSRRLDYHPHLHVVIPGGGVDAPRRQWKKLKGQFLFNEFALAKVFRARLLKALVDAGLDLPKHIPEQWVVNVRHVGKGLPALKYLSRYLYRGVISEKNIIANQDGQVTFRYIDSSSKKPALRTVDGAVKRIHSTS